MDQAPKVLEKAAESVQNPCDDGIRGHDKHSCSLAISDACCSMRNVKKILIVVPNHA